MLVTTANIVQDNLYINDALSYLDLIRNTYSNRPEKYDEFVNITKELKSHSINFIQTIDRVAELFKDRPELIEGFNHFLPDGYHIQVEEGGDVIVTTPQV